MTLQLVVIDGIFGTLNLLLKFNVFLVSELMKGMPRGWIPFQLGQKVAGLNNLDNGLLRYTPHWNHIGSIEKKVLKTYNSSSADCGKF